MARTELNFRGLMCPMPIMKIALAVQKGTSSDIFEVTADDPAFEADIKAWCSETGNALGKVSKTGKETMVTITKK